MRRVSAIYKIITTLAIFIIFAGTQGFVISSHTCNSCGTHVESISFFSPAAGEKHSCNSENPGNDDGENANLNGSSSCCSSPDENEPVHGSCCSNNGNSCESVTGGVCCEYETERVTVEPYSQEKNERNVTELQPLALNLLTESVPQTELRGIRIEFHNKHGGGRDITKLTCCLLL